jgi:hypothetical protein
MFIYVRRTSSGQVPELRELPGLTAIREVVGRATEVGRPVLYTGGMSDVTDVDGLQMVAGLAVLASVAEMTAEYGAQLICTVCKANLQPITEAIVKQAYANVGKSHAYRSDMVRFLSPEQMAYAAGTAGIIEREKVAGTIMVGGYYQESMMIAEAGAAVKAIQIGGTVRMSQLPFFVISCDYTLIGEEIYAGGAYLSKSPALIACLAGQDVGKVLVAALILLTSLGSTIGSKVLVDFLRK